MYILIIHGRLAGNWRILTTYGPFDSEMAAVDFTMDSNAVITADVGADGWEWETALVRPVK